MIRPVNFSFNPETAVNNAFQVKGQEHDIQDKALSEFENFVGLLRENGVDVTVIEDTPDPYTPDSIFPNNWISFHHDGTLLFYPMYAVNRRRERKQHVVDAVSDRFLVKRKIDLSGYEERDIYLEGTGSMVLDRDKRLAYACLSPRTNLEALEDFCSKMGYRPVWFHARDSKGQPIYHTNVMMCVADRYVVICLDSISDPDEKERVIEFILDSRKEIIPITLGQVNHFAGNMLQVENNKQEKLLVMSTQAFESLTPEQRSSLAAFNNILHAPQATIEANGGGSARCMMAELHLELRKG
jgi:hypothetical protein